MGTWPKYATIMYLIDTSVWIRHFSERDSFELGSVCPAHERLLCLPVYQEILQGIRDPGHYRTLKEILDCAVFLEDPMTRSVYIEAAELYRSARRRGLTIRSAVDCQIAACAIRHNVTVLHSDRDYSSLARVSELRERNIHPVS